MDTYSILREIADSWVLLAMTTFFLGCCFWAFRPGSRPVHDEAAALAVKDDTAPALTGCGANCAGCTCRAGEETLK
ncbi:cytochrome c oxidase cbb3-type subunit 4 [Tranquillimonas rosea]|uniref:Cytochrome c oxidase cbb3-type subunit 4 n=1 Tax=Tranquillimonas rosea TaxID=641238 RepID=A0A1H9Q1Z0_9RHOB|nr:cbb3-type cytochrome c oxidase subunit 3 [Tranquillimonas rosea]SER53979.1 cytochrome c oxidase cbb3-type subunit 4 [Tranquillimonas rosea]